ncbi:MAG: hypothetical protein LBK25_01150 [Treponema sp.]|nr:hypothetical protein [Treponema sp.]
MGCQTPAPPARGVSHRPPALGVSRRPLAVSVAYAARSRCQPPSARGVSHRPLTPVSATVCAARRRRARATRRCQTLAARPGVSRAASDMPSMRIKKGGDAYKHLRPPRTTSRFRLQSKRSRHDGVSGTPFRTTPRVKSSNTRRV